MDRNCVEIITDNVLVANTCDDFFLEWAFLKGPNSQKAVTHF